MATPGLSHLTVVVLNSYAHPQGGASRVAIDEAVGLAARGTRVIFFSAVGPVCEELRKPGIEVICLEQHDLAQAEGRVDVVIQGLWNFRASRELEVVLKKLDPASTIVHLHGFTQALSTSPVRCAVRAGFEVVYTLHDFFLACPNGGYFDFRANEQCRRVPLSLDCIRTNCDKRRYGHKAYRVVRSSVQRQFGELPRGVMSYISLSRGSEAILQPHLPPEAKVYGVENPIPIRREPRVDVARNRKVITVARFDPEKGIDVLLEAARRVGVRPTLVGDGALRQRIEETGVADVTGWLSREAVAAELETARCLVFPSLWYETYGLVVAEAAARGIPSIVSDRSAAAERVIDGVTGWHARTGDPEDLARCLRKIEDDAVVESAGLAAYDHYWAAPPTLDRHIDRLTDAYLDILSRRASRK